MEMEREIPTSLRHRLTSGLLIMYGDSVLLVKQKHSGKYSIPKGEVQSGEDILGAAIRETYEETGLQIDINSINKKRHLCSISTSGCRRLLYYYSTRLEAPPPSIHVEQNNPEIVSAAFYQIETAVRIIQISQVGILWDEGEWINPLILDRLHEIGWITLIQHPHASFSIVNYTDKCKTEEAWNDTTMWCRGLIVGIDGRILSRPMKKFFEFSQLYEECRNLPERFTVTEKLDGSLGISYFINNTPYIATRGRFFSSQAIKATSILYLKYSDQLEKMEPRYTYLFEIIYPEDRKIVDYGPIEDIILLDIVDRKTGDSVFESLGQVFSFPKVQTIDTDKSIEELIMVDILGKEGYVLKFEDGRRLKIKFKNYKEKWELKRS